MLQFGLDFKPLNELQQLCTGHSKGLSFTGVAPPSGQNETQHVSNRMC